MRPDCSYIDGFGSLEYIPLLLLKPCLSILLGPTRPPVLPARPPVCSVPQDGAVLRAAPVPGAALAAPVLDAPVPIYEMNLIRTMSFLT